MSLTTRIRNLLALESSADAASLDDVATTIRHGEIIRGKPFLRRIYQEHYAFFQQQAALAPAGIRLEIGSGAGFLKERMPDVVTSDVRPVPGVECVLSAMELPFPPESLGAIFMLNVLHHVPNAGLFFQEASRCLKPGGRIALVEPANTGWSRFVYGHFHHEPFRPEDREWRLDGGGPMSCANDALPWMIFCRDRQVFEQKYPRLHIESIAYCHPFRYLLSGGVSMKQLVPTFTYPLIAGIEATLRPFNKQLAMFMRIVVVKS